MKTDIWTIPFTMKELQERAPNSMIEHLGIEYIEKGPDYLIARMPIDQRTKQPVGILHGGASVALAETLGSVASWLCVRNPLENTVVGIEVNANHIKPGISGYAIGKAFPIKIGLKIQIWQIEIRNDAGELLCISRLTTMVIPKRNK